jgi:hypothetical protein
LGILFVFSAAAAVRVFRGDPSRRITGVLVPAAGAAVLTLLLIFSFVQDDSSTRIFIITAAAAGIPLALWRARVAKRATLAYDVSVEGMG